MGCTEVTQSIRVLTVRSSKAPDTRVEAQSTPPGATPGRCCHSGSYSPLSCNNVLHSPDAQTQRHWLPDTCLHCPVTRRHGTDRTLLYSVWIHENTDPAGHLFTLSGHENMAPAGHLFALSGRVMTFSRYRNTRHRPDTY